MEVIEEMDFTNIEESVKYDKNMILFGPSGTGKTYHTTIYAVAICDGKPVEQVASQD